MQTLPSPAGLMPCPNPKTDQFCPPQGRSCKTKPRKALSVPSRGAKGGGGGWSSVAVWLYHPTLQHRKDPSPLNARQGALPKPQTALTLANVPCPVHPIPESCGKGPGRGGVQCERRAHPSRPLAQGLGYRPRRGGSQRMVPWSAAPRSSLHCARPRPTALQKSYAPPPPL